MTTNKLNDILENKIAIYVRESRDDNEENIETIETQRDLLIDFIKKNALGDIFKIYCDDNISGSSFDRHGIMELKNDVINKKINMLILKDLSRLGRNNAKTLLFLDFLEEHDVRIITYDGRYDSLKDNDTVGIQTWFNEHFLRDISKKIRANLKFKILRGEYIGHAPFGFVKSETEKNKLIIDDESAHIVKKIYNLYLTGLGYQSIANTLNSEKIPPPSSKSFVCASSKWNSSTIQRILSNKVYIGYTVQGVSERISFKSKKSRRLPKEKWIVTPDTHKPIIDNDLFSEVQKIRDSRRNQREPNKGYVHLLKGILFCGDCHSKMFARVRKNRPLTYICSNYVKNGRSSCSSHSIKENIIIDILIDEIKNIFSNTELRKKIVLLLDKSEKNYDFLHRIEKLKNKLNTRLKQQESLYFDKLDEKISEGLFFRTNKALEEKIESLQNEITKLLNHKQLNCSSEDKIKEALHLLGELRISNQIVKIMVNSIYIYETKFENNNFGGEKTIEVNFKY